MATRQPGRILESLRRRILLPDGADLSDGQLLECFLTERDEAALAALVRRHEAMVWGVCRRLLRHHDAEDAFQATFLVLVRKAPTIRPRDMLANWLYGVAFQTARKAQATLARRRQREQQGTNMPEPSVEEAPSWRDLRPVLDQELSRLPDRYRLAVVLCDVEGRTRKEAARHLGLPEGTLSGHLTRGRRLLARRLTRQGVALSGGALATLLGQHAALASAPPALLAATIQAANLFATGTTANVVSTAVARLTEEVLRTMWLSKFKVAIALLAGFALVLGLGIANGLTPAQPVAGKAAAAGSVKENPAAGKPGWHAARTIKHEQPVTLVASSAEWSAAGDEGGNLFVWDTRTGKNRKLILKGGKGLNTSVDRLQFTPDGEHLFAVLSGRRGLFRLDLKRDNPGGPGLMAKEPSFLGVSPDGETWLELYGAGRTLTLRPNAWTAGGGLPYETIRYAAEVQHAVVAPDGKQLGVVTADGSLYLHELPSRRKTQTIAVAVKDRTVKGLQFSPDGKCVAVVADDAVGTIYDIASAREVATLKGHRGIIFTVAFSPDGKQVATGGDDTTARLWDAGTGKALAVLEGHTDSVLSVAFTPDGQRLITGSADRTLKIWTRRK
jgi:RNA polymerase sigma factor (sigma-70 family)